MIRKLVVCLSCIALMFNLGIIGVQASGYESVTGVSISAPKTTLEVGEWTIFTATVSPSNASNKRVTWSSSNDDVAEVDDSGYIKALEPGTTEIKVITEDRSKRSTVTLTVKEKTIMPKSISFSKVSHTMNAGDTYTIIYTIYPKDATDKKVNWKSSDSSVATVSNGVVTAVAEGVCKITGTTDQGSYSNTIAISVKPLPFNPFGDTKNSPYKTEITALYDLGIVQGSGGNYRPGDVVTRAELATILAKAFNLNSTATSSKFKDVVAYSWYFRSVSAVESNHMLYGYMDGTFKPSNPVTLEEVAAVVSRLFVSDETLRGRVIAGKNFVCSTWANGYVDYATKEGLVDVTKIATFNQNAKREEVAYMIYNVLKQKGVIKTDEQ